MVATIVLIILVTMLVFGFLEIPGISTIPRYTTGMLFGIYNPFFYAFGVYWCLSILFGEVIRMPKWIKLNAYTYWIVALSIIFVSTSLFYYQDKTSFTSIGGGPWKSFGVWFDNFRETSAWYPQNTNGGVIGVFLYSFFAMIASGIGAMIISIGALAISISYILTGTAFGFYKSLLNKKKLSTKHTEKKIDKEINISNLENQVEINEELSQEEKPFIDFDEEKEVEETTKEKEEKKDDLPFEDPFE